MACFSKSYLNCNEIKIYNFPNTHSGVCKRTLKCSFMSFLYLVVFRHDRWGRLWVGTSKWGRDEGDPSSQGATGQNQQTDGRLPSEGIPDAGRVLWRVRGECGRLVVVGLRWNEFGVLIYIFMFVFPDYSSSGQTAEKLLRLMSGAGLWYRQGQPW